MRRLPKEIAFTKVTLALTGLTTFVIFLGVSIAEDFDPMRAIAAFVALAVTKYVI